MLKTIANTVRGLAADGVEKAQSGHPGMPLGGADIGAVLFAEEMKYDPARPDWPNRDRFILSAGHGSMFLYAFLHIAGYDLPMEELKNFRQLGSKTPGHPEYGLTPGVETTTGPLGQGVANAVGMALAERMLAARFNKPGHEIVDHYTYCLCGDGDLMEGVSGEASSLAGHLRLGKLIVFYDANQISIEGSTELAFTEDVGKRYEAYGWHVQTIDGHNYDEIKEALRTAKDDDRPSLIIARTHIGYGSPKQDSAEVHGAPLGSKEIKELKKNLGLPEQDFYVPEEVYEYFRNLKEKQRRLREDWEACFAAWSKANPELRVQWDMAQNGQFPSDLAERLPKFEPGTKMATRDASGKVMQKLADAVPYLVGGSADLAPSTKTYLNGKGSVSATGFTGRNLHFGVREHGMGSILNGMSLYGGFRVYGSTFLSFADYMRPSIRMAALMHQPVIFVFTHDSIWVGEDGPTHQPIEQLESLRIIPNVEVFRPAEAEETRAAWVEAVRRKDGPTVLILTRQKLPVLSRERADIKDVAEAVAKGGYVLRRENGRLELTIVATGSEVSLAWEAVESLESAGHGVRVVSVPCRERFLKQSEEYRTGVLGEAPRLFVEAGVISGWGQFIRTQDRTVSLERFGESGPGEKVAEFLGLTAKAVLEKAKDMLI